MLSTISCTITRFNRDYHSMTIDCLGDLLNVYVPDKFLDDIEVNSVCSATISVTTKFEKGQRPFTSVVLKGLTYC